MDSRREFPYRRKVKIVCVKGGAIMWVEFKCPICGRDLDDDTSIANFMICNESSHGTLRFFTGDGCFFTSDQKVAEELMKKGKRVHIVDPQEFFARQT